MKTARLMKQIQSAFLLFISLTLIGCPRERREVEQLVGPLLIVDTLPAESGLEAEALHPKRDGQSMTLSDGSTFNASDSAVEFTIDVYSRHDAWLFYGGLGGSNFVN